MGDVITVIPYHNWEVCVVGWQGWDGEEKIAPVFIHGISHLRGG